jgi:hypothetical protein
MAVSKRTKNNQRVLRFPKAKGKIIAEVELSLSPDYNVVEIVFQDKTSLTFNLESCFQVTPELSVGSLENINRSNAGELFTASNSLRTLNQRPA